MHDIQKKYKIILASQSPRRQQLLKGLGLQFDVQPLDVDETWPAHLKHKEIAVYLSELKAHAFDLSTCRNCLVITADTIVWLDQQVMPKPKDRDEAFAILSKLSGREHEVITGVTLRTTEKTESFCSITKVFFKELSEAEIDYYIREFQPFDKAGAYGVQEWIGFIGIDRIEGSYFNVVGLPVKELYDALEKIK
ncbi:MAG: septum formation protein Maf [Bacteroidales bacterium]|nr:septum formation protein Maf [Bacteroidales bacterium]